MFALEDEDEGAFVEVVAVEIPSFLDLFNEEPPVPSST